MLDVSKLSSKSDPPHDSSLPVRRPADPAFRPSDPVAGISPGWEWHRDRLRRRIAQQPIEGIPPEEVDAHFAGMPAHYWDRISDAELVWSLQTVHRFLTGLVATESGDTALATDWRHYPRQDITKFLVCTWDRQGLLTKLAGYISALRLNVVRAEVYTRADNIVLDFFWLCDGTHRHITDLDRLRQLSFLLEGGLAQPPRFVSTWAVDSHKHLPRVSSIPTKVMFSNSHPNHTIVTVEASERLGLLHDILQVFSDHEFNIAEALIDTIDNVARDVFFVTDHQKNRILDPQRLAALEVAMIKALE